MADSGRPFGTAATPLTRDEPVRETLVAPRWWVVVSPVMAVTVPLLDDGTGPVEEGSDVALVRARTAADAKWAAYRLWQTRDPRHGRLGDWPREARDNALHPLHGVTAKRADEDDTPDVWYPWVAYAPGCEPVSERSSPPEGGKE